MNPPQGTHEQAWILAGVRDISFRRQFSNRPLIKVCRCDLCDPTEFIDSSHAPQRQLDDNDQERQEVSVRRSSIDREIREAVAGNIATRARYIIAVTMANTDSVESLYTGVFPAAGDQVAQIRKVVGETIGDNPGSSAICLLASELATNAIRHSGSRFLALAIDRTRRGLRVAVIDEGRTGFPTLHDQTPPDAEGGRGMMLIDSMARRWGIIRRTGSGTAVWFEYAELSPVPTAAVSQTPADSGDDTGLSVVEVEEADAGDDDRYVGGLEAGGDGESGTELRSTS